MADEIKCPVDGCDATFTIVPRKHDADKIRKDIQHHLVMRHGIEVIESHKRARAAAFNEKTDY
jgi:hypothetical protein